MSRGNVTNRHPVLFIVKGCVLFVSQSFLTCFLLRNLNDDQSRITITGCGHFKG